MQPGKHTDQEKGALLQIDEASGLRGGNTKKPRSKPRN